MSKEAPKSSCFMTNLVYNDVPGLTGPKSLGVRSDLLRFLTDSRFSGITPLRSLTMTNVFSMFRRLGTYEAIRIWQDDLKNPGFMGTLLECKSSGPAGTWIETTTGKKYTKDCTGFPAVNKEATEDMYADVWAYLKKFQYEQLHTRMASGNAAAASAGTCNVPAAGADAACDRCRRVALLPSPKPHVVATCRRLL